MSSHAIVTGGAGFLGSHLVDSLVKDGYQVTVLDNFGSGQRDNLAHLETDQLTLREHDVRDTFPTFDVVDVIFDFASRASPVDFGTHAINIALTNAEGARNAFDCALKHDARVVLASTSEVYGDPEQHPQSESYNGNVDIRGPRAPYDESKRFAETLAEAYYQQRDLDVRTVRIFNTYGPRMRPDDGRVIPTFLRQALDGENLTVYGDGSQTRSFCYVSDLISGIRAFERLPAEEAANEVINIGSTEEITITQLAEIVLETVETSSNIVHEPLPEGDPKRRRPDTDRAENVLGWEQTVGLREGLSQTVEWFSE